MQALLAESWTHQVSNSIVLANAENIINAGYNGYELKPCQFSLKQPFQRSNASRQEHSKAEHAGTKRRHDSDTSTIPGEPITETRGQPLPQHVQNIVSAHKQLLQLLYPGWTSPEPSTHKQALAAVQHGTVKPLATTNGQPNPSTVPVSEAGAGQQPSAAAGVSYVQTAARASCGQVNTTMNVEPPASTRPVASDSAAESPEAAASSAAVPSTDWTALAAMKHVLKPKISYTNISPAHAIPKLHLRQHQHHPASAGLSVQQGRTHQQPGHTPANHKPLQPHQATITCNLFNTVVSNPSETVVVATAYDQEVLLPARSSFCMSDLKEMKPFIQAVQKRGGASLLVIDPPWENASARRSAAYGTLTPNHLLYLPVKQLVRQDPGTLVALWMTNRPRLHKFTQQQLLPAWGLEHVATWLWLKVTDSGEPVSPLTSLHRHPFEQIWLLRVQGLGQFGMLVGGDQQKLSGGQLQQEQQTAGSSRNSSMLDVQEHQQQQQQWFEQQLAGQVVAGTGAAAAVKGLNQGPVGQQVQQQQHQQQQRDESAGDLPAQQQQSSQQQHSSLRLTAVNLTNTAAVVAPGAEQVAIKQITQPPDNHVIISVPGQHSRKPHLGHLLLPYVSQQQQQQSCSQSTCLTKPADPGLPSSVSALETSGAAAADQQDGSDNLRELVCVELFARELFPGWLSWGNEVIKFQSMEYWVKQAAESQ